MDTTPQLPLFTTTRNNTGKEIPYGYCHCGCGQKTKLATQNSTRDGLIKGEPIKYLEDHRQMDTSPLEKRFWDKVDRRGQNECWEWKAANRGKGYGCFGVNGKIFPAHRVAYELTYGPIPDGEGYHGTCVLHSCDNRACCNPAHLSLGTQYENMQDRNRKGRQAWGERMHNYKARFTSNDVIEIRRLHRNGISQREIADLFNSAASNISQIVRYRTWKHLP